MDIFIWAQKKKILFFYIITIKCYQHEHVTIIIFFLDRLHLQIMSSENEVLKHGPLQTGSGQVSNSVCYPSLAKNSTNTSEMAERALTLGSRCWNLSHIVSLVSCHFWKNGNKCGLAMAAFQVYPVFFPQRGEWDFYSVWLFFFFNSWSLNTSMWNTYLIAEMTKQRWEVFDWMLCFAGCLTAVSCWIASWIFSS